MFWNFLYLDGDQGLFVVDVDEDVVPGREADVICNRSGAVLSSRDLGIPEPRNLGIDLQEGSRLLPHTTSMIPIPSQTIPITQSSSP